MTIRCGLQLYSVRQSLKRDPWGTLRALSDAGFRALEAANHNARNDPGVGFGVGATELRRSLDDLGMRIVGCHVNPLEEDILPRALDYQAELGNRQIGCDIEFYPYGDLDYLRRRCELFNRVGALCAERGMRFYYHNHYQEFQRLDGRLIYELIMEHTDPALVWAQLDTYWMYRGGQDPIAWMRRMPERVILLHQKDFPADARQPLELYDGVVDPESQITMETFEATKDPLCFTEIGSGTLPIGDILTAVEQLPNVEYVLLEQDHTTLDELDSVRRSKEMFSTIGDVDWS
jgi:sugar phosphate isomerase/epimerase